MSDLTFNTPNFVFQTSESGVAITRVKDGAMHSSDNAELGAFLREVFLNATSAVRTALLLLVFNALA